MSETIKPEDLRVNNYYLYKGQVIKLSVEDLSEVKHSLLYYR